MKQTLICNSWLRIFNAWYPLIQSNRLSGQNALYKVRGPGERLYHNVNNVRYLGRYHQYNGGIPSSAVDDGQYCGELPSVMQRIPSVMQRIPSVLWRETKNTLSITQWYLSSPQHSFYPSLSESRGCVIIITVNI